MPKSTLFLKRGGCNHIFFTRFINLQTLRVITMNSERLRRVVKCKNEHWAYDPGKTLSSSPSSTIDLCVAFRMLVTSFILASASPRLIRINSQTCTPHHASNTVVGAGTRRPTKETGSLHFQGADRPCTGGDCHMRSF